MPRSTRSRPPQTVSIPQRVVRRWREGVVIANLSVAGYLAQLPRIEDAIFGPGMLTTLGIGVGAGLGWMVLRGALSSGYDFSKVEPEPDVAPHRTAARPSAPRARSVAPPAQQPLAPPGPRTSSAPRAPSEPRVEASHPRSGPSSHPYAHAQTGQTVAGFPSPLAQGGGQTMEGYSPLSAPPAASPSGPPIELHKHATPHNQAGSTLHGYASVPPQGLAPASSPPSAFSATRPGGLAAVASMPHAHEAFGGNRPSGPPTARMTALQEAELSASPAAARASERPSDARLSWPPEVELSPESRSQRAREGSLPPPKVAMATLARRVASQEPDNDGVISGYIDTDGEPAVTLGASSSAPPDARGDARASIQRRVAARVDVLQGEADPPTEQLDPDLRDQLEELRAELLTMSPSHCFVVGVSSDGEHMSTKSALAVQLALQLQQSGSRRVLLVEANATRPMLDRALELYVPLAAGFSQQMHRRMTAVSPSWTVLRVAPTLDVLAEGRFRTPGMLYGSVFAVALHELRDHYDVIVADGPVVETAEAAAAFARVVDGIGYLTSGLPSIRVPRERALARFKDKALFKVLTTR